MTRKRVIINFAHLSVELLIELAWFIISKMTGNVYFTTPDPTLASITALVKDLETKNTLAQEGGRQAHSDMLDARDALLAALRSLGLYVEKIADGNETILISSGFPLTKDHLPKRRDNFWAKRGPNAGDILVGCVAYPKAKAYVWQRFVGTNPPTDDNLWVWSGVSTQTKMGLTNLDSGSRVWLRYCAVTKNGMMEWSNPIDIIVG